MMNKDDDRGKGFLVIVFFVAGHCLCLLLQAWRGVGLWCADLQEGIVCGRTEQSS